MSNQIIDISGQRFYKLTAIRVVEGRSKQGHVRWLVKCDCGTEKIVFGYCLIHKKVKSCGCLINKSKISHGMYNTPEYMAWRSMKSRCSNKKDAAFVHYGARGIRVCDQWKSFENFYKDMGERPTGKSLDRIDNNGPYSPDNCRWATAKQQVRNTRVTTYYEYDGITLCLQEWAEIKGICPGVIYTRYKRGWRGEKLFSPSIIGGHRRKQLGLLDASSS